MKSFLLHLALFAITAITNAQFTNLLNFSGSTNGGKPQGSLLAVGSYLYGMTEEGGVNGVGTIFRIKPDGTGFEKLMTFDGATKGSSPQGSLISDGSFLYGMTPSGGASGAGTIFKIMLNGGGYVKLFDFNGTTNGASPGGSLFSDGTFLYGMTEVGGSNSLGTIFKIKTDGTGFVKLLDFNGSANGSESVGNSFISDGTFLYGTTYNGGANEMGTIFKIKPDGTGFLKLLDFNGSANGSYAYCSLISDGTFLYGMTYIGGANNLGTIFKIKPDGTGYVKLFDFDGATNGKYPRGSLVSDGTNLYGMAKEGGANDLGTIFKYQLSAGANITQNKVQTDLHISPNPFSTQTLLQTAFVFSNAKLTIYNSFGQAVKQINNINGQTVSIMRENLPTGLYFIRLEQDNKTITTEKITITD